ncbi:hypothetical protein [Nannocystis sp. SCPEA4]|uniref:hypothetical protein n=1 Tax=Nannocystis sp. SCPEA4 TaxID=2996787 RepID=UPI002270692E|nr:hypothetical protein [Nannocystis sp. SCPEA4]MCY1060008.1 hypothetical protein [Nannocystis sp. SCPEA4]
MNDPSTAPPLPFAAYSGREANDPAPPQSPEKKGRVEAGVGYLRRNFLSTVTDRDVPRVAEALQRWVAQTANQRIHGTTGRRPADAFEQIEAPRCCRYPPRATSR